MTSEFLLSTGLVALAEIGDKTQILSLCLISRFPKPAYVILGIFAATLLNHALAAEVGHIFGGLLTPQVMDWIMAASYTGMAIWSLIPDKAEECTPTKANWGVVASVFLTFFMAEMGDKTQLATVALAAKAQSVVAVMLGTTTGMMLANVPVILFGARLIKKIPMRPVRLASSFLFVILAASALWSAIQ